LRAAIQEKPQQAPGKVDHLKKKLAELDAQIGQAGKNILLATDNLDVLQGVLNELRAERARLAGDLRAAEQVQAAPAADREGTIDRAINRLFRLRELLAGADPARLREVLRSLIDRVDIFFTVTKRARRKAFSFSKALCTLRQPAELTGFEQYASRC
jgi:hypothetical protein